MSLRLMTTQWTEYDEHGTATIAELIEYLKESDLFMTIQGRGYGRIKELKEMVRLIHVNQSDKLQPRCKK